MHLLFILICSVPLFHPPVLFAFLERVLYLFLPACWTFDLLPSDLDLYYSNKSFGFDPWMSHLLLILHFSNSSSILFIHHLTGTYIIKSYYIITFIRFMFDISWHSNSEERWVGLIPNCQSRMYWQNINIFSEYFIWSEVKLYSFKQALTLLQKICVWTGFIMYSITSPVKPKECIRFGFQ